MAGKYFGARILAFVSIEYENAITVEVCFE